MKYMIVLLLMCSMSIVTQAQYNHKRCEINLQDKNNYQHVQPKLGGCKMNMNGEMSVNEITTCLGVALPCMFFADSSGYIPQVQKYNYTITRNGKEYASGTNNSPLLTNNLISVLSAAQINDIVKFSNFQVVFNCADCDKVITNTSMMIFDPIVVKIVAPSPKKAPATPLKTVPTKRKA